MLNRKQIGAIVLAAGSSHRFGANKLLHPVTLHGVTMPLAAHSLLPWLHTFERVNIVVKAHETAFCHAIESALGSAYSNTIQWIVNSNANPGLAASINCGIAQNIHFKGCLIGLADMPAVPSMAIEEVLLSLLNGAQLSAPFYKGRCGHPVGFSSVYFDELLALQGETGARSLLERDQSKLVKVSINNIGIFTDVDSSDDVRKIEKIYP